MTFLFKFFFSHASRSYAVCVIGLDLIGMAAAFLSGEAMLDVTVLMSAFGLGS